MLRANPGFPMMPDGSLSHLLQFRAKESSLTGLDKLLKWNTDQGLMAVTEHGNRRQIGGLDNSTEVRHHIAVRSRFEEILVTLTFGLDQIPHAGQFLICRAEFLFDNA